MPAAPQCHDGAVTPALTISSMRQEDWPAVAALWAEGIATRQATFELEPLGWEEFDRTRHRHLRLVATAGSDPGQPWRGRRVLGWAAASPVSTRRVYAGVAEHSVYVAADCRGQGVGRALLAALVRLSEACGIWTLRSGVFPENQASLALHEGCGFSLLGRQAGIGRRDGRWRDVLLLERRSPVVGLGDEPLIRLTLSGPGDHHGDVAAVRALLAVADLPPEGLEDAWRCWVADADGVGGQIIGAVAVERHQQHAADATAAYLLRSLVVSPAARGGGLGRRLVEAALTVADLDAGTRAPVALLTQSADAYFARLGFTAVARGELPAALEASAQLRGACPDSARAYVRGMGDAAPGA